MASIPILVVDDDPGTCANCSDILGELGYSVNVAYNGDSAIDLVRRNRYQLALLDFKLPGLNGLDLFRDLRKLQSNLECSIITGFPASMTFDEVQTCGACSQNLSISNSCWH